MLRFALWCLSLAAAGCTLIGEGELGDKPSEAQGGAAAVSVGVGGATASSATEATTTAGPAGPGPAGPGAGGSSSTCDPGCAPGNICQGNACVCDAAKPMKAADCPSDCDEGCDLNKGLCRIRRDEEADGPETIVCPPGMDCEISCKGTKTCYEATIQCPESFACKVDCDGYQACKSSHLIGTTGALTLTCKDIQACQDTVLTCGAGKCDYPCFPWEGTAECGNSCACAGCP